MCALMFSLCPALASAQFELLSPANGAEVYSPPTLEWAAGSYDVFVLYTAFSYAGLGYYTIPIGWYPITSLPVGQAWWDAVADDVPNYWFVLGLNTTTYAYEFAAYRTFTKKTPSSGMAQIPGGCFDMGDHFSEGAIDELPAHNVCISAFEMDVHEVTNAEYAECVAGGGCTVPSNTGSYSRATYYGDAAYDDFPVISVDWYQASDYCAWTNKRLPTEAEWEYAARGGLSGKRFPWGDTLSGTNANYWNSGDPWDNDTSEVEYYAPNGYGLYDMAGNVWEWVNDWWQIDYYSVSPPNDPPGPPNGTSRGLRGGAWVHQLAYDLRVADRVFNNPGDTLNRIGFRCARGGAYGP